MIERYRGSLIGVLCGDALGAPYEWKRSEEIQKDFATRGGLTSFDYIDPWKGVRHMRRGQPTDDSELTAALAQSLVESKSLDRVDLYNRLRSFIHGRKSLLTNGDAYGSGGTLRASLEPENYDLSQEKFLNGEFKLVPSNGSLMRTAPIALMYRKATLLGPEMARQQSAVTHAHAFCGAACAAYVGLLAQLLEGVEPNKAWERLPYLIVGNPEFVTVKPAMKAVLDIIPEMPSEDEIWPHAGSVLLSFKAALWAVTSATDFRDGLTKVVGLGGDTDTYGAIAGGLLGARFGFWNIPREWLDTLQGTELMISFAHKLFYLSE